MNRILTWFWLATLAAMTSAAFAQGDDEPPSVPRAITTAELRRYGDILRLSDDQRHAAELEFERYLDDFEPLRAELIELASRFPRHSGRRHMINEHLPAMVARVQALDQAFFERVSAILADDQRTRIPRVASLRERTLLTSIYSVAWIVGDSLPDLRELLERLQPAVDIPDEVEAALAEYESRLTPMIRNIHSSAMNLCGEQFNQTNEPVRDQIIERIRAARALNLETFERLAPMLDDDARRRWRHEFLLHAYGSAAEVSRSYGLQRLNAALASDLTDEQRATVQSLHDEIVKEQRAVEAIMMELLDREAIRPAGPQGARGSDEYFEVINATRQRFQSFDYERLRSLQTLLGKERVDALPRAESDGRTPRMRWSFGCGVVSFVGTVFAPHRGRGVAGHRMDALLAAPISAELFNDLMALLRVDGEMLEAAKVTYDEYVAQLEKDLSGPRRESYDYSMQGGRPAQPPADPLARMNKAKAFHAKTRSLVDAADAALFARIEAILGASRDEAAWERMHRTYRRARASIDIWWRGQSDPNQVCAVDFIRLLARERPDEATWASIETQLAEYETMLLTAHERIAEAYSTMVYDQIAQRDGHPGESPWSDGTEAVHVHGRALAESNHRQIESMLAALPDKLFARLWPVYARLAFPPAFDDAHDLGAPLERALAMPELTADQRARLAEARMNHAMAMQDSQHAIADLCAAYLPDVPGIGTIHTDERTRRDERFQEELQRLRDQRDAANREALRALRTTLAPAQLRQVRIPDAE